MLAIELDDVATLIVVEQALNFSFLEKDSVKDLIRLPRPACDPLDKTQLSSVLLDGTYLKIKAQFNSIDVKGRFMDLTLDSSDNVRHDRGAAQDPI